MNSPPAYVSRACNAVKRCSHLQELVTCRSRVRFITQGRRDQRGQGGNFSSVSAEFLKKPVKVVKNDLSTFCLGCFGIKSRVRFITQGQREQGPAVSWGVVGQLLPKFLERFRRKNVKSNYIPFFLTFLSNLPCPAPLLFKLSAVHATTKPNEAKTEETQTF